jgi:hypothetical protein
VRESKADRRREQLTSSRGVFVPLAFQPGEAFQFDWSEDWAILGGERTKLQVARECQVLCVIPTALIIDTRPFAGSD